ncbi:hypothetical protein PRIPAC_81982 [Pristionchus pacificus]|uniref:Uncharacterized protein n=1 Tax=Pristionchus pacificus TaxID=54126 RepID=A0A2A6CLR7_PRIPA|nr:hypothetical protein PRIPAC_81982 [Pristionchus pacificus]|eukprot:PDM79038.1 hypothetical protein PRIPAC_31617 [Pristionchus pacificus]
MSDRCCFGLVPITIGARILTCISILCSTGSLMYVLRPMTTTLLPWFRLGTIVLNVSEIGAAVLVFMACRNRSANKILPMLFYCVPLSTHLVGVRIRHQHHRSHLPLRNTSPIPNIDSSFVIAANLVHNRILEMLSSSENGK